MSRHGKGIMMTVPHALRFFIAQVGDEPLSLYAKIISDFYLFAFPCPDMLLSTMRECCDVVS